MAISNVWVFAQGANGAPTSATQELLTKAREISSSVTAFVAGEADSFAAGLGEYGATKVYATGDLGGKLPGVAAAAAMKAVIDSANSLGRCAHMRRRPRRSTRELAATMTMAASVGWGRFVVSPGARTSRATMARAPTIPVS